MNNTKLSAICDAIVKYDASFEEAKHPRDEGGKFSSGAGSVETPKGYKLSGKGNLAQQGFKPKKRTGRGPTITESMQVAWGAAQASGKPETLVATGYGWQLLTKGNKIAHGQPHIVVTPSGDVHSFKADI